MTFRLATFENASGNVRAGIVVEDMVYDLAEASGRADLGAVLNVLEDWAANEALINELVETGLSGGMPLEGVRLLDPVHYPPTVYCAGQNYADHIDAMMRRFGLPPGPDLRANGGRPFHFLKASRCCVGDGATVRAPTPMLDWEGELVVVIGRKARNVEVSAALNYVAGYMVGNDLSARDWGFRSNVPANTLFSHSFLDHKSFEHSAPVGPWIVPASQVGDPADLRLTTLVNGVVKQNGNTGAMIFSIQEQIAYLSRVTTLLPGDIIMTGTPAGAGAETGEFLKDGDEVVVSISKLGSLRTVIKGPA